MIHFNYNIDFSLNDELAITDLLKTVALSNGKSIKKFFFHFVSEAEIQQVNKYHLNHDFVTDVITFDYSVDKKISAEAFICPAEVLKNAKSYKQSIDNEHVRVVLHALLHVVGYDDKTDKSKKEMRKQEEYFLAVFNKKYK